MRVDNIKAEIKKKIIFVFLLCFLVSVVLVVFTTGLDKYAWRSDFVSFITGARIVREGNGVDIYNLDTQREYQFKITAPNKLNLLPFRNPPITTFFFIPLSSLSINDAYKIYTLILTSVLVLISWLSLQAFENLKNTYWFVLPFIFHPSIEAILSGQISVFLLLVFMFIFIYLKKENYIKAGFLTGFLLIKFQYIISFPFILLLVKNKNSFLKGFTASTLLIVLGSTFISGPNFIESYLQMLIITENPLYSTKDIHMFSLFSALSQITSFTKQNLFIINSALYLLAIWFYYKNYKKYSLEICFSVLLLLTLVFCVHGGNIDMALLLIPIWLLIDVYKGSKKTYIEHIFVIFILIFTPLVYILELSYIIPFLFLLSVALLFRKINLDFIRK